MNKLGIQWQRETDAVLEYNRLVQPTVLKSINCHSREFWQQLMNDNPNSIRIYRHYPNYDDWRDEPEQCAVNAVHAIMVSIAHIRDLITHIEDNNEWVFPFFSNAEVDAADRYMETFIKTAWSTFGMCTVFLNSACGHWGDDITVFHHTLKAAKQYWAILGQHEYDYPTMDRIYREDGDYWLCGKWQKSMAAIKAAGYAGIKVIITETGIDGGVTDKPMKGWRSVPNSLENYAASLLGYNDLLIADEDVLGAAIFIMSGEGMWGSFDIENSEVPARIAGFPTVPPPAPPEPPNGGEHVIPDRVKIYDFEHGPGDTETRDQAWLESIFGPCLNVHPITDIYTPAVGDVVYQLEWVNCKPATVSVVTIVEDVYGEPVINEGVVFGWSTADPHGLENRGWNWTNNGAVGWTEPPDGHVGPAMSKDSYYSPDKGECGAHFLWIWGRPGPMIDGIGLLPFHDDVPGANHLHVEFGFRAVTWGGGEPPVPPNTEMLDEILHEVKVNQALLLEILAKPPVEPPPELPPTDEFAVYFFNTVDLSGPVAAEMKDPKAFWHNWSEGSPVPGVNANYFSVKHEGTFRFEARPYTFNFFVDDGVKMWVDDVLVFDAWKDQPPTSYSKVIEMTAGTHKITLRYYEKAGGATFHFNWE